MAWLNCEIATEAPWPSGCKEVAFGAHKLFLMPLTRDNSASVHIELQGRCDIEGVTVINRFLSVLSWKDDAPAINYGGFSGSITPQPMQRSRVPLGYHPIDCFPDKISEITGKKARLAVALYREAKSLDNGVPYQFLSYFKILNIFWSDKKINGKNQLVEGLRCALYELPNNEYVNRVSELEQQHGDVARYLYESGRCAVAHAFSDPIVDPDDVADVKRLSEDLLLLNGLAVHLIKAKFGGEQSKDKFGIKQSIFV